MSRTKSITIWCNGCGNWIDTCSPRIKYALKEAKRQGRVVVDNEDICPNCLADLKAGMPLPSDEDYNADN